MSSLDGYCLIPSTSINVQCSIKSLTPGTSDYGQRLIDWLSSVLRPLQHSIGYMGDGFYRSKDPTNSIKVLQEKAAKENHTKKIKKIDTHKKVYK